MSFHLLLGIKYKTFDEGFLVSRELFTIMDPKKVMCSTPGCWTIFTGVPGTNCDQSVYVIKSNLVHNWELSVSYHENIVKADKLWPVVCVQCKKEFGFFYKNVITIHFFRIKYLMLPTLLSGKLRT